MAEGCHPAFAIFKVSLAAARQVVPGPCSPNHCPCYPELSTTGILSLMGKQQITGLLWSAPPPATINFSNVLFHIPVPSIFLSQNPAVATAYVNSSAWASRALPQHPFTTLLLILSSVTTLPPPTQTKLTGPGDFANALPVSWSVILLMQVLLLLPILNLNHLFQDGPNRLKNLLKSHSRQQSLDRTSGQSDHPSP